MKNLYLVGGTMGVGKSSVCKALAKSLPRSVFLDGDWCWAANPFTVTDETKAMVMDNIIHLLGNFLRCSAYDNVVFCWVMDRQSIIDDILNNLNIKDCRLISVSLTCDKENLISRLKGDIKRGKREKDIIERSIKRLPLYEKVNTVKVDTSAKSIEEIAKILYDMGEVK